MEISDICIETNFGSRLVLKDVRHVPDLHYNLLSIGKIDEEGYYSHFDGGLRKMTYCSLVVAKGKDAVLYIGWRLKYVVERRTQVKTTHC